MLVQSTTEFKLEIQAFSIDLVGVNPLRTPIVRFSYVLWSIIFHTWTGPILMKFQTHLMDHFAWPTFRPQNRIFSYATIWNLRNMALLLDILHNSRLSPAFSYSGKRRTKDPSKCTRSFIKIGQVQVWKIMLQST